ncbi:MAG TPA: NrfD/PsrC family molybdoenzyme membrane anchor subunit [Lacipirellulaceae bacterium]|nr:NrfD/PsrC family molybdoenzyme membrane anchor subunit [Lacipirellulaceae bacterium]
MATDVAPTRISDEDLHHYGLKPQYVPSDYSLEDVSAKISAIVVGKQPRPIWWMLFLMCGGLLTLFGGVIIYLLSRGVGIWGINIPVAWGVAITCFVWWIGIGHAGTLISAFLLLMHQKWRTSINRLAEAMTIFAVMTAGMFPLLHLGRPWFFYWLLPYADTMGVWPQFRSALVWDVFAVSTYFLVSLLFWYMGMIPDLAKIRDRTTSPTRRSIYGILAMGWRNSAKHWHRYEMTYLLLGGLATPLVVSVHSVVSSDFASSMVPGWHETVFPPYFVAGAILSGFAMVIVLCIPLRIAYRLQDFITRDHLDVMGKLLLATSLVTSYGYLSEQTVTYFGGDVYDSHVYWYRLVGSKFAWVVWTLFTCNTIVPQLLWIRRLRRNQVVLFFVSLAVLVGMWFERYMIILSSLSEDFLPSAWGFFKPTLWDILTFLGSVGFFLVPFLLFVRFCPLMSISETQALLPGAHGPEVGR